MNNTISSVLFFCAIAVVCSITGADNALPIGAYHNEIQVEMAEKDTARSYSIESYNKERDHVFITAFLAKDPHNFPDAYKASDLDSEYVAMDSSQEDGRMKRYTFKQTILVCCLDAHPVGFVRTFASSQETPHRTGLIAQIAVKEEVRRNGIGTLLLTRAIERLKATEITTINLGTRPDNIAAHALYEKVGFEKMVTTSLYCGYVMQSSS